AELTLVHLGDERGHQLAVSNRPRRGSAHRLVDEFLHRRAVEIGAVHDQLDGVRYWLARDRANEREQDLDAEPMPAVEDRKAHAHSFLVAALTGAGAVSYCRVAWPTAAHTTISKTWSSLRPDALATATSWSVTRLACLATLSTSVLSGSVSPAFSNAARRQTCGAMPCPSRMCPTNALRARVIATRSAAGSLCLNMGDQLASTLISSLRVRNSPGARSIPEASRKSGTSARRRLRSRRDGAPVRGECRCHRR